MMSDDSSDSITSSPPSANSGDICMMSAAARHVSESDCKNKLYIFVEEAEQHTGQSQDCFSHGLSDRTYKKRICVAATSGNWAMASSFDKTHPNWISTRLTVNGDTALHFAVSNEKTSFVEKLVKRISKEDTEIRRRNDGNTAFCIASISGNVKIATILLDKNPELVWIRCHEEMLPLQLASLAGQHHMVKFLFQRTQQQQDMHIKLNFQDTVKLFFFTLTGNIYSTALRLLDKNPRLATTENEKGLTALQLLAQSSFDKHAPDYRGLLSMLFKGIEEEDESLHYTKTSKAMFYAAKSGNNMILEFIFNYDPSLFLEVNSRGQTILHIAILYRQGSVFRLILAKGAAYMNILVQRVDNRGNNVLHLAGNLAAEGRFGSPIYQSLIHSEELWFKEVEKIVPPAFKTMKNKGLTPKEIFYEKHKRPYQKAIVELNGIANNFLVVATLLITLGITGALTIRTNNISGKTLIFKQEIWYTIFLLSVGCGVSSCVIYMLLFTSVILPTTWRPNGHYINSRLTRMTFGYSFLYFAILVMGIVSTTSGAILVYNFLSKWKWVFYLIGVGIGVPTILYFFIFYYSFYISLRLVLAFSQQWAAKILSKMGIDYKWDPFYLE